MKPRTVRLGIRLAALLSLAAAAAPALATQEAVHPAAAEDLGEVTATQIEAKLRVLASDEFEGRATGTSAALAAANFLIHLLVDAGVEPGGDVGLPSELDPTETWCQDIERDGALLSGSPGLSLSVGGGDPLRLEYGADYDLVDLRAHSGALRVIHVRDASELPAEPDPAAALFLDGKSRDRRAWLEALDPGAYGAVIEPGSSRSRPPSSDLRLGRSFTGGALRLRVHGAILESLRASEQADLEVEVAAPELTPAVNVLGVLAGVGTAERPELAEEVVVLTAHYDHIGMRTPKQGDPPDVDLVYNGADDDASGVVAVLEIAEALAAGPPPARTVVFLLVTGEERGLLGSKYYVEHPLFDLEHTVCNLNFEMVGRPFESWEGGRLWLTGDERSSLGPALRAAGLAVAPDPHPQMGLFRASDNYAFARRGIVAQTFSSSGLHEHYHKVSDEVETLDLEHMATAVRNCLAAARLLADGELTPEWLPGGDPSAE